MEFACHAGAFNDLNLTGALGTIARMGFRYVDIGSGPHLDMDSMAEEPRGMAAKIKQDLQTFNLKLSDVCLNLSRISLADEQKRSDDIEMFKSILPFLVAIGTPGVTLSPGLTHPEEDTEALDRTVTALREMISAAKAATPATNLQVSIEPQMDSMAQTPEIAQKLVEDVPGLSLTLDWAQMVCQDIFHDQLVELIPLARHIQIRQAARAQLQVPFDRGRINIEKVIKALKDADYDGVICVEYMQKKGWHGAIEVDGVTECIQMRDAMRDARNALNTQS